MSKILYAASTMSHITSFHLPYINALRDEGHEVYTMASGEGADFNIPFEKKLISKKNRECRKMIREIIEREHFDVILLNTTLAAFHIRLALSKKDRPRVVNFVHGYLFSKDSPFINKSLFSFCERILKDKTDAIIVMNDEDEKTARSGKYTSGDVFFAWGMGAGYKAPTHQRDEVRARTDDADSFVITFVGELSHRKNQAFLISALKDLKEKIPNAVLWLVGDGECREEYEVFSHELSVSDSVRFIGHTCDASDYIAASDLYVSASKSEGLPFNILEAMSQRITVLASEIKGHTDIIEDGVSGFLYTAGDIAELCAKICDIHEGELTLSKDNIYEGFENYSFESVFPETLKIMKSAMELKE